jgi:hypothetical protein
MAQLIATSSSRGQAKAFKYALSENKFLTSKYLYIELLKSGNIAC